MWEKNFAAQKLEQSPENGFGETPLKKYRRHIFLLHPDKVVIYDELEAGKAVNWDWLLHSPVKFDIDQATGTLTTRDPKSRFIAVARLFSEQPCSITQTNQYIVAPNKKIAVRGEDFSIPWSLTARFGPSKANRILTIIQLEEGAGKAMEEGTGKAMEILRTGNKLQCGDWTIEAELDARRPASVYIHHEKSNATFSYGHAKPVINNAVYKPADKNASLLYDLMDGKWQLKEMQDKPLQPTGKK